MSHNSNGFNGQVPRFVACTYFTTVSAMDRQSADKAAMATRQFLTFYIGEELFAIAVEDVREVIEYGRLTDVPMMPAFLRGVTNLRGAVIPVIDLSLRFGRAATQEKKRTCIVIIAVPHEDQLLTIGVIVDAVNSVVAVDDHNIEATPSFGANIRADFISAMLHIQERFVIALDVNMVLSVGEIIDLVGMSVNDAALVQGKA